jgi:hypothetical protein
MSDLSQTLEIFKIFCLRLVLFFMKICDKHPRSNVWPCNTVYEPWERQMLSLFKDEHRGCSKPNQKETTKQQPCICNAKREGKTRLLVKFDPWLGFFTPPKEGYRNRVRQVLDALWKLKHDIYYNAMQGTTQAHFLKLLESSTFSSLLNLQKVASSKGLVKISANWFSLLTPSSDISFLATWSLRKWWRISMCLVRECYTRLLAILMALSLSHKSVTLSRTTP